MAYHPGCKCSGLARVAALEGLPSVDRTRRPMPFYLSSKNLYTVRVGPTRRQQATEARCCSNRFEFPYRFHFPSIGP